MSDAVDKRLLSQVGERLREMRQARGLTQEEVGELAGFTGKYISEVERGLRDVPLTTLRAVVERALDGTLASAFEGVEPTRKSRKTARPQTPMPRSVQRLAQDLATLDDEDRRRVVQIVRQVLQLME